MRARHLAFSFIVVLGLSGCGSDEAAVMPDVTGKRLDVALSDIERAGMDDGDVEVLGGGVFGVVDESNWTVCEQEPPAGDEVSSDPRLTVERSCEKAEPEKEEPEKEEPDESPDAAEEPSPAEPPAEPELPDVLTVENNKDLAALLQKPEDYDRFTRFAKTYQGKKIEFDGNLAALAPHGNYKTRVDALIYVGDYSETEAGPGPSFQFRDVGSVGLLSGPNIPEYLSAGLNLHIIATVDRFERRTGLFLLKPDTVTVRN